MLEPSQRTSSVKPTHDLDRLTAIFAPPALRLGVTVSRLRADAEVTRRALAQGARLNADTVARVERGWSENPSLHTVAWIAVALGISVVVLTDAFVLPLGAPRSSERAAAHAASPASLSRRSRGADLGLVVRAYRTDEGLTVAELEALAQTSRMQLARVEAGRPRPSLRTLARIAAALDGAADMDDLSMGAATLGGLAQVYTGEVDARTAILDRRQQRAAAAHRAEARART